MTTAAERPVWGLALLLLAANTLSFVDRTLLTLLVAPIRADLGISDTVISLLHGLAFAALYAVMGLPLGRWADRGDRPRLMASGVGLWSVMTMASGAATSVAGLAVARAGVAIGEASLSPAAVSLLSDRVPRPLVARTIALFQSGIFLGSAAALMGGGALLAWLERLPSSWQALLGGAAPWRAVFVAAGAPGLLVALLLLAVREPRRTIVRAPGGAVGVSLRAAIAYMTDRRGAYGWHLLAFTAITVLAYGTLAWTPTTLVRTHGVSTPDAGIWLGAILMVAAPAGVLTSGMLVDRTLARGSGDGPLRVALAGLALLTLSIPAYALAPSVTVALLCYVPLAFALGFPYGIASGALALITPPAFRGQVTATYLLVSNLVGLTFGPLLVALGTERLFGDPAAVRYSLALLPLATSPIAALALVAARAPFARAWREVAA